MRTLLCLVLILAAGLAVAQRSQESGGDKPTIQRPRFEDYPVAEKWAGPAAPVKLTSPLKRLFRTNLREAAEEPPDFAGHYRFTEWGCGTRCVGGAIVDLQTGNVFPLPLAGKGTGEEYWIFCVSLYDKGGVEHRVDSRLMIIRCGGMADEEAVNTPDEYYFLWETDHFRRLLYIKGAGKHGLARNATAQGEPPHS